MISRSSPRYSIIKLRVFLTFYIYYNKFFKICQIVSFTYLNRQVIDNIKKKQTKRLRCKKTMLESLFVSNTFSKYIRTDTNAQPILVYIYKLRRSKICQRFRLGRLEIGSRCMRLQFKKGRHKALVPAAGFESAISDL